jgi:hypothetical protein
MKISTLLEITSRIEAIKGVRLRGTVDEVTARVSSAAAGCRSKKAAAQAIAEQIFSHPFNGDYPATEAAILEAAR